MLFWYADFLMGETKYLYPDWKCTKRTTDNTRVSRKANKLRGKLVTPQPVYSFHTPFYVKTDGKQWVIQADSSYGAWKATGIIFSALFVFCVIAGIDLFQKEGFNVFVIAGATFLIVTLFSMYKTRIGGENTWVVFDRTTGNVCFWRKNQKNSLTVPFDKVNCYWIRGFQRGGVTHNLYFMPTENLPNERHRWWKVHFGFPTQYEQAQFFWRVLTDFMDRSRPIPEVPGLIHQVRFVEKNGYTIEDLTEGGVEMTEADFNEVDAEIQNDIAALEARLERLLEPDQFSADRLIEFYENAPVYARTDVIRSVMSILSIWISVLKGEDRVMDPAFRKYFTLMEYEAEIDKLADFFFRVDKERRAALT
ncbi:hypothetical protein [Saccharospirillum salsuginis]|uniref:hypothetical protein n=1 Tax=Saccharospirillum salsuginis TaxID=418750 RepID=UPI001673A2AD|nr:hypothetical protein [Saccharospirillum salsuginis]